MRINIEHVRGVYTLRLIRWEDDCDESCLMSRAHVVGASVMRRAGLIVAIVMLGLGFARPAPAEDSIIPPIRSVLGTAKDLLALEKGLTQRLEGLGELAALQIRAGLQHEAEDTQRTYVALLHSNPNISPKDVADWKIRLLLKAALVKDHVGNFPAAVQYFEQAVLLATPAPMQETAAISSAEVTRRMQIFSFILDAAVSLREERLVDKVVERAQEMLVGMNADVSDKRAALLELLIVGTRRQLSRGRTSPAREGAQFLLHEFYEDLRKQPCRHSHETALIEAEIGKFESAVEIMGRCRAFRALLLKDALERELFPSEAARYRFSNARDSASLAEVAWKTGNPAPAVQLLEQALTEGRTTPFHDERYYWRQLVDVAVVMRRVDVVEEAVSAGYGDTDEESPRYRDLMRFLLEIERDDLIASLASMDNGEALIQAQVERGDYVEALKAGEKSFAKARFSSRTIRELARAYVAVNGVQEAVRWSGSWTSISAQVSSLFGVVDHLTNAQWHEVIR